jgi:hypothetical protein
METTHESLDLDKRLSVQQKLMDTPTSFISVITLFDGAFKYGDGAKF